MNYLFRPPVWLLAVCLAQPFLATAQSEGVPPEWEVRKSLVALSEQIAKFQPLLESLNGQTWKQNGAPETYVVQLSSAKDQLKYLIETSTRLGQQPDKLSLALETCFRLQTLETQITSITEAVRKYQNTAIAELIQSQMSESAAQRQNLRNYVVALAAAKEEQFAVADKEAQRCRDIISRQSPPAPAKKQERK